MKLTAIGHIATPFRTVSECPRNGRQIRPAPECFVHVDPAWQAGLRDLDGFSHLILLYWLGPQEVAPTLRPAFDKGGDKKGDKGADGRERGVFATRSPARPNPVGLSVVELLGVGEMLTVRNLDCVDGTPLLDIKPYLPSTDAEPGASMGWLAAHRTVRA